MLPANLRAVFNWGSATSLNLPEDASFEEWWEPFTQGVGPAGEYVTSLASEARARLRARLSELAGEPPVDISATAWTVTCRT